MRYALKGFLIPQCSDPNGGTPKRKRKRPSATAVKKADVSKCVHYDNAFSSLFIVHGVDIMAEKRTRNWSTIIYPRQSDEDETTCPDNWADILGELGVKCAVSPLHDQDLTSDGEKKKPHRHVVIAFEGVKTRTQAKEIFDRIGGVGAEPVNSMYGMTRYLTHMDNPEKAQYSSLDVLTFGGFEYKRYASSKEDEEKQTVSQMGEIMDIVSRNMLYQFADLAEVLMQERPDLFTCLRKNSYFFACFLKSKQTIYINSIDGKR